MMKTKNLGMLKRAVTQGCSLWLLASLGLVVAEASPADIPTGQRADAMARIKSANELHVTMKKLEEATDTQPAESGVAPFLVRAPGGECGVCDNGGQPIVYEGAFCGFDIEVAHLFAKKVGAKLKITFDEEGYDDVVGLISKQKADIAISTLSSTLRRAQYVAFTDSYLELNQTLLVNRSMMEKMEISRRDLLQGISERNEEGNALLNQVVIGVEEKSSYADFASDLFKGHTVTPYSGLEEAMKDLLAGKIFAINADNVEIAQLLRENAKAGLFLSSVNLQRPDEIRMAVNYSDVSLLNWANLFLRQVSANGELEAIKQQCGLGGA